MKLVQSGLCHADETGINVDGKRRWESFHSSKVYYAMIIGSRISNLAVSIQRAVA